MKRKKRCKTKLYKVLLKFKTKNLDMNENSTKI